MRAFSFRDLRAALDPRLIRVLAASLIGVTLSSADQSLFSYAIPDITREFRVGLEVIGQLLSLSFLVASFAVVACGMAADEWGRRVVFVAIITLSALCVGLHALAPSLWLIGALRIVGFALGAGVYPIANTLVLESAPLRYRGFLAGLLQIGYPLGFAVASLLAAPLFAAYGWRAIFVAAFGVAALAPLLGRLLPADARAPAARTAARGSRPALARIGRLFYADLRSRSLLCLTGGFLVCFAIGATTYFLPTYLVQSHGLTPARASALVGGSYAIGVVGYLAASYVGEFVTTRRNTLILWIFAGAAVFAATLWGAESESMLLAGLGASVMFFYGTEAVRMPMIGELFPAEVRVTATAVTGSLAVTIAWIVCPLVVSALVPRLGWTLTLSWCVLAPLLLGGCVFLALINQPSGEASPAYAP